MSENILSGYDEYKVLLEKRLTPKRFRHSICVAEEAYRLAEKYGADCEKAYLAGLLHDITKNASQNEHLNIFKTFDIILDKVENASEKLWHAISGAAYVRYILNIQDEQIIAAIRYHTTACADLPLLSKILYLADFTSADRDYEDVAVIRKLVDASLNGAYAYALRYTIKELAENNNAIHSDTVAAYNEIMLWRKNNESRGNS